MTFMMLKDCAFPYQCYAAICLSVSNEALSSESSSPVLASTQGPDWDPNNGEELWETRANRLFLVLNNGLKHTR